MDGEVRLTHGFLFADLRGYTAFVDANGDAAGARLLRAYRDVIRGVIGRFSGAEIRTEGDGFYVVFPSASAAVAAGLAIVQAAQHATTADAELPLHVGIGIHAGETEATDEGYVGSAVNLAARLCALAAPGEVLVSDTVRGLTRTQGNVIYTLRGSRRLKGIAEPVATYSASPAFGPGAVATVSGARFRSRGGSDKRLVGVGMAGVAAVAVLGFVAVSLISRAASSASPTPSVTAGPSQSALAASIMSVASMVVTPSTQATDAPSAAEQVRDLLSDLTGELTAVPPGRYRLPKFASHPLVEFDAGWSVKPISSDRGHQRFYLSDRPSSILVLLRMTGLPTDVCGATPPGPLLNSDALQDWLRAQPALDVGPAVPRSFGHVNATQLQISVVPKTACTLGDPRFVVLAPYGSEGGDCCTGFNLTADHLLQLYVLAVNDAVTVAVVDAPTQGEFEILLPKAEGLLDTLEFPGP